MYVSQRAIIHDEDGRIATTTESDLSPPTAVFDCPRNKISKGLRGNIRTFFNRVVSIGSHNARNFSLSKYTDGDIPSGVRRYCRT